MVCDGPMTVGPFFLAFFFAEYVFWADGREQFLLQAKTKSAVCEIHSRELIEVPLGAAMSGRR